jgi:hypothetical protein
MPVEELLVRAGLLSQPCLEAALKLNERARQGRITLDQAAEALARAATRGGRLDDEDGDAAPAPKPLDAARKVVDLLLRSGLIGEDDVKIAAGVKAKHGGDSGEILVSAGQIDQVTLKAARRCQEFIDQGRLKFEQAIIALHYCQRMRSELDEALRELAIDI